MITSRELRDCCKPLLGWHGAAPRCSAGTVYLDSGLAACEISDHGSAVLLGSLVYRSCFGDAALRQLLDMREGSALLKERMRATSGQFCLVLVNEEHITVVTDPLGMIPVYFWRGDSDAWALSNDLELLVALFNCRLDRYGIGDMLTTTEGFSFTRPLYRDIEVLPESAFYVFGACVEQGSYMPTLCERESRSEIVSEAEAIEALAERFQNALAFLPNVTNVVADLTGGVDTRVTCAYMAMLGVKLTASQIAVHDSAELQIAEEVAEALGVFFSPVYVPSVIEQRYHLAPHCGSIKEIVPYFDRGHSECSVHITGMGGTELCTPMFSTGRLQPDSLHHQLLGEQWQFFEWIHPDFLSKHDYEEHVLAWLVDAVAAAECSGWADKCAALWTSIFNRRFHGAWCEKAALWCHPYSPYLDWRVAETLLQTPRRLKSGYALQKGLLDTLGLRSGEIITTQGYVLGGSTNGPTVPQRINPRYSVRKEPAVETLIDAGILTSHMWDSHVQLSFGELEKIRCLVRHLEAACGIA